MVTSFAVPTLLGGQAEYPGGWHEVGERAWAWLQPNGRLGESNAGLICGDDEALLVDTLWDPALTEQMLRAAPVPVESITVVVNTHGDGDHCWGNQVLPGRRIVSAEAAKADMTEFNPHVLAFAGFAGSIASPVLSRLPLRSRVPGLRPAAALAGFFRDCGRYRFRSVRITLPTETFEGRATLLVGGRRVELIEVGPAHTKGDVVVVVPDTNVIFSGDILFSGVTPIMWAGPVENWIKALRFLLSISVDSTTIVPGHGPVSGAAQVRALLDYWELVALAASDRHKAGQSALAAAEAILSSGEFAERGFDRWHDAARLGVSLTTMFDQWSGRGGSPSLRARGFLAMSRLAQAC